MVSIKVTRADAESANVDSEIDGTKPELTSELLMAIKRGVTVLAKINDSDFESTLDIVYVSLLTNHKE